MDGSFLYREQRALQQGTSFSGQAQHMAAKTRGLIKPTGPTVALVGTGMLLAAAAEVVELAGMRALVPVSPPGGYPPGWEQAAVILELVTADSPPVVANQKPVLKVASAGKELAADIYLPGDEAELLALLDAYAHPAQAAGIVVSSLSDGLSGKAIAAGLAREVARAGRRCALVDLQAGGGGIDLTCGIEGKPGLRWDDLQEMQGPPFSQDLWQELPTWNGVAVLAPGFAGKLDPGCQLPDAQQRLILAALGRVAEVIIYSGGRTWEFLGKDLSYLTHLVITGKDLPSIAALQQIKAALQRSQQAGVKVQLVASGKAELPLAALQEILPEAHCHRLPQVPRAITAGTWRSWGRTRRWQRQVAHLRADLLPETQRNQP